MEGVRAEALGQTKLAFDDLVNEFNAAQNTPGVEEALETKHWSHAAFYPPVILFDDVVQVGVFLHIPAKRSNPGSRRQSGLGSDPDFSQFPNDFVHIHRLWPFTEFVASV
jgi:hypothetical protein